MQKKCKDILQGCEDDVNYFTIYKTVLERRCCEEVVNY
jgi:hypothetical protein